MFKFISLTVFSIIALITVKCNGQTPTVSLAYATVVGSTSNNIDTFQGIPFAQPPTGSLRLKPPQPITSTLGVVEATSTPLACPQFNNQYNVSWLPLFVQDLLIDLVDVVNNEGEDCLTLNVQRPSNATAGSNLPVVFVIFGGAFAIGSTQGLDYTKIIQQSEEVGTPLIFVAVNYRVGGFGFLPGKEILADGSANLGLLDQRLGLQWVADNIEEFGGDPSKVTIYGWSAGSISVYDQMALYGGNNTYNGKPLFSAALMESGSILPTDPVDCNKAQIIYDTVVENAGCAGSNDTLACLRSVDYATFLQAATSVPSASSYSSIALSYLPRPDGSALPDSPEVLAANGQWAQVPFLIGDEEDEGTLFSIFQSNISTSDELVQYLSTYYFQDATLAQVQDFVATYPDDPADGSPFGTGEENNIYPEYKRLAAILGDFAFTLERRRFLELASQVAPSLPTWSYITSYLYDTTFLGTFHGSTTLAFDGDVGQYAQEVVYQYYISFFSNADPNANNGTLDLPTWPLYNDGQQLFHLNTTNVDLVPDTFRPVQYNYISANSSFLHF